MIEYFRRILNDQFDASLCTLGACVEACPEPHWEGTIGRRPFWQVAYHTLFYVDLYLSLDEASYEPRPWHRQGDQNLDLDAAPGPPHSKDVVRRYVAHCSDKVAKTIVVETPDSLERDSGFPWYRMSRGEHHLTSVRHVQHHAGQLCAYLRREVGLGVDWYGKASD